MLKTYWKITSSLSEFFSAFCPERFKPLYGDSTSVLLTAQGQETTALAGKVLWSAKRPDCPATVLQQPEATLPSCASPHSHQDAWLLKWKIQTNIFPTYSEAPKTEAYFSGREARILTHVHWQALEHLWMFCSPG